MESSKDNIVDLQAYRKTQKKAEELKAIQSIDRGAYIEDLEQPDCYSHAFYKVIRQCMYNSVYVTDYDVATLIKEFKDNAYIDKKVRATASLFYGYLYTDVVLKNELSYKTSAVNTEGTIEKDMRINYLRKEIVEYLKAVLQKPERVTEYDFISLLLLATEGNISTLHFTKNKVSRAVEEYKQSSIMDIVQNKQLYNQSLFKDFADIPVQH